MRILLVEDEEGLRTALADTLAASRYAVDCCANGPDALDAVCTGGYDLVLLDRMLPGLDGLSVLRQARQVGVTTPVLLLTALDAVGDRVEGLDAGADDYLSKPFATEELLARIRALGRRPAEWEQTEKLQNRKTAKGRSHPGAPEPAAHRAGGQLQPFGAGMRPAGALAAQSGQYFAPRADLAQCLGP